METTSTIIKLRNSERIKIITESDAGKIEEKDFTDKCDLASKDGVKVLRDFLKDMTDMTASQRSAQIRNVDISLPIPFLQVITQMFIVKFEQSSLKKSMYTRLNCIYRTAYGMSTWQVQIRMLTPPSHLIPPLSFFKSVFAQLVLFGFMDF